MYHEIYKIAGHIVEIHSLYEEVHRLCKEYRTEEPPEYKVVISAQDIRNEQEKSASNDKKEGNPVKIYSEEYLETLAVYRKITEYLIDRGIVLFHGSVVAVDGEGYLFTAKSGTGKSTHTNLWMQYFCGRSVMVNDDKPLLKVTKDGVFVYGTPWDGKHRLSSNVCVPLKAICLLNRGKENKIVCVEKKAIYPMLVQQIYRAQDALKLGKTLQLLELITENVGLYELYCNMETEAAKIAFKGMNGGN